ncbi:Arc family DNA-binding protein [Morganella morganii]|uniref:Arc family DNA-binding protein n=1 Tax=Morganella morganii TaxID=582 RepID=UPI001646E7A1|nr:Arc family DNA-binding protein [Morganella morganii]
MTRYDLTNTKGVHVNQKASRIPPYPLRMPTEVREWYENEADSNARSLNAELVKILIDRKNRVEGQRKNAQ